MTIQCTAHDDWPVSTFSLARISFISVSRTFPLQRRAGSETIAINRPRRVHEMHTECNRPELTQMSPSPTGRGLGCRRGGMVACGVLRRNTEADQGTALDNALLPHALSGQPRIGANVTASATTPAASPC